MKERLLLLSSRQRESIIMTKKFPAAYRPGLQFGVECELKSV